MVSIIALRLSVAATILGLSFQGEEELALPLLDKMKATLTANIDVTSLNGYIQEYVQNAVDRKVKAAHEYTVNEINGLKTKIDSLSKETKSTLENLTKNLEKVTTENQKLEKRIEEQKLHQSKSKQSIESLKRNVENLKNENQNLEKRVEELISYQSGERPAFTAYFDETKGGNRLKLISDEILRFNAVIINKGNGYDPLTGLFTAPRSGVYLVSSTVRSLDGPGAVHVNLWKNDERLIFGIAHEKRATGSFSVSIEMKVGDRIFVRHYDAGYTVGEVLLRNACSMFSAAFISE